MFRNIDIWNSFNFNAKKVAKVAHPLREGPGGPGARVPIPFNLVPRDHEKLGSLTSNDHSEGNNDKVEKETGLISNATTLHMQHAVLSISLLLLLHDYDVKFPRAGRRFMKEVNTLWRVSFVSPSKLGFVPLEFNSKKIQLHLLFYGSHNDRDKVWKQANSSLYW